VLSRVGGIHGTSAQVVRVSGDPAAVAARLNRTSGVAYAEPNYILHATAIPNDPRFGELYGLNNTGQSGGLADGRYRRARGLGDARRPRRLPEQRRGPRRDRRTAGILQTHEDLIRQDPSPARQSQGVLPIPGRLDPGWLVRRRQRPRHTYVGAGRSAANANNGKGVAGSGPSTRRW